MANDGTLRQASAADKQYNVAYFAKKHSLLASEARQILEEAGTNRARADLLAEQVKTAQSSRH